MYEMQLKFFLSTDGIDKTRWSCPWNGDQSCTQNSARGWLGGWAGGWWGRGDPGGGWVGGGGVQEWWGSRGGGVQEWMGKGWWGYRGGSVGVVGIHGVVGV